MSGKIVRTSIQPDVEGGDLVTLMICDGSDLDAAPVSIRLEARIHSAYLSDLRDITVDALLRGRDLLDEEIARLTPAYSRQSGLRSSESRDDERRL